MIKRNFYFIILIFAIALPVFVNAKDAKKKTTPAQATTASDNPKDKVITLSQLPSDINSNNDLKSKFASENCSKEQKDVSDGDYRDGNVYYGKSCVDKFLNSNKVQAQNTPNPSAEDLKGVNGQTPNTANSLAIGDSIQGLCRNYKNYKSTVMSANIPNLLALYNRISTATCELDDLNSKCADDAKSTASQCLEEKDSTLSSAAALMGPVADAFGTMSMADACSKLASFMEVMNGAVGAFRLNCGRVKSSCESSCGSALSLVTQIEKDIEKSNMAIIQNNSSDLLKLNPNTQAVLRTLTNLYSQTDILVGELKLDKTDGGLKSNLTICANKELVLQNAGNNIIKLGAAQMSGKQCAQAVTAQNPNFCTLYPNLCPAATTTPGALDCSQPANSGNTVCICRLNPLDPSCSPATVDKSFNNTTPAANLSPTAPPDLSLGSTSLGTDNTAAQGKFIDGLTPTGSSSGASAGGSSGGGGGPSNLGSVGSGGANPTGGGGRSGVGNLDTNIGGAASGSGAPGGAPGGYNADIMGNSGGGGAGGGFGGGNLDFNRKTASEGNLLKDFLPGSDKDPKKLLNSLARDGVTSMNGMTLFEKINKSYRNKKNTLIED